MSVVFAIVGAFALAAHVFAHHPRARDRGTLTALLALDALLAVLVIAALVAPGRFAAWMQEDAWAEWATFLAFAAAAALAVVHVIRGDALLARLGAAGLALFCVFVAGEEISWGQRLLAFEPPELFLAENFQQELNVHNLVMHHSLGPIPLDSRTLVALIAVVFGVVAPLLWRSTWMRRRPRLAALEILLPPLALAPAFVLVAAAEMLYPVSLTGEACELVLGMLFVATATRTARTGELPSWLVARPGAAGIMSLVVALALLVPPILERVVYGTDEDRAARARAELQALVADLPAAARPRLDEMSSVHKRLFTAVRAGYLDFGAQSSFLGAHATPAAPTAGAPVRRDRRGYFLDPWNNPYWLRWRRSSGALVVYSFGANRRRDSDFSLDTGHLAVEGDDLAAVIRLDPAAPSQP